MSSTFPLLVENFAPWLTAIGAFTFGILSHARSKKSDNKDAFQKQLEQLHGLYHTLTVDLGDQVERLTEANTQLAETNEKLAKVVEDLTEENADLKRSVKTLTSQVKSLKKQIDELSI